MTDGVPTSVAPSAERPADGPPCSCGAPWNAEPDRQGLWRCQAGHPRPGAPGPALTHGSRSVYLRLALIEEHRAQLEERRSAILADLGGAANTGVIKTDVAERYLETTLMLEWLGGNLLVNGVMSAKGSTRAAATLYLQVLDRFLRLVATLGLERQAKAVGSLAEYMNTRDHAPAGASEAK